MYATCYTQPHVLTEPVSHLLCSAISNVLLLFFMGGLLDRVGLAWMSYDLAAYWGRFSVGLLHSILVTDNIHVPYTCVTWKFSLDKSFAKTSYLCIAEIFGGINFHQCSKGCHIPNVIITREQMVKLARIFSWQKFPHIWYTYMCIHNSSYETRTQQFNTITCICTRTHTL